MRKTRKVTKIDDTKVQVELTETVVNVKTKVLDIAELQVDLKRLTDTKEHEVYQHEQKMAYRDSQVAELEAQIEEAITLLS